MVNVESLIKSIVVLHHGNAKMHMLMMHSFARQIENQDVHDVQIDSETKRAIEMIATAKYSPFVIEGDTAKRTIEALVVYMTTDDTDNIKLVMQTNNTECPVVEGMPMYEKEICVNQTNKLTTIEEYSKILKEFNLYFEEE